MRLSKLDQLKNLSNKTVAEKQIKAAIEAGRTTIRTGYYTGSGKYTRANDVTADVSQILNQIGIKHTTGNDAPRGGTSGNYVEITSDYMRKVIRKDKRESDRQELIEKWGTDDPDKIAQLKAENERKAAESSRKEWEAAVAWVESNRNKLKEWWYKRSLKLNGRWGSTQAARRMAFRFSKEAGIGMSALKHAIKGYA